MSKYEFILRFALPVGLVVTDDLIEGLGDAGCDDALIGVGRPGRIALDFTRTAVSAHSAIVSAIADLRTAIPDVRLIEITPDLVGVTEVADLVGRTRQNMRQLLLNDSTGPMPVHEGASALWHLAPMLVWLRDDKAYAIDSALIDVATVAMEVNSTCAHMRVRPLVERELEELLAEA